MVRSLQHIRPGDKVLSASGYNVLVDKLRQHDRLLAELQANALQLPGRRRHLFARRFVVSDASDWPDTIECREIDGTVGTLHVARPYLLRRSPFDTLERNGIAYDYLSNTERIARKQDDEGNETTETQIIIPRYVQGDVIYAVKGVANGTESYVVDMATGDRVEVSWIDLNVDGRFWARKAGDA